MTCSFGGEGRLGLAEQGRTSKDTSAGRYKCSGSWTKVHDPMILAVDGHYQADRAHVAGVAFERWSSAKPQAVYCNEICRAPAYVPGEFYKRELPGILTLLQAHDLSPGTIVVDGYVYLDGASKPGLGKHLYDALDGRTRIIGLAKSPLPGIGSQHALLRGKSSRPLYVTAAGLGLAHAKACIVSMHGGHRMPTLLKMADRECRRHCGSKEKARPARVLSQRPW